MSAIKLLDLCVERRQESLAALLDRAPLAPGKAFVDFPLLLLPFRRPKPDLVGIDLAVEYLLHQRADAAGGFVRQFVDEAVEAGLRHIAPVPWLGSTVRLSPPEMSGGYLPQWRRKTWPDRQ